MEFGKLENVDGIDFTLPESNSGSLKVLGGKKADECSVYVGCPIWSEPGFVGKIYPAKAKSKDYPKYYSQQFNSIEFNISHYKNLEPEAIEHWRDITTSDFKFFPKVNQAISHTPVIKQNASDMKAFLANIRHFQQKLGMPFLQLPPNYDSSKIEDLLDFCDDVTLSRCAVELRHESWFQNQEILKRICNYFYKNNITFLITDTAGRRDVVHQLLTTKTAFIRFVANDLHASDYERMRAWINRIELWIENGLEELFFFFHTPTHSLMPEMLSWFITEFNKQLGYHLRLPKFYNDNNNPPTLF